MSVRTRSWLRAGLVLAAVVLVDQVAKAAVRGSVMVGEEDSMLPGITLVHVRNSGVAFGAFAGGGIVVVVLVAGALAALLAYFVTHLDRRLVWLPTGLLLGGSLGNIIDRVRDGAVTDFIKLPHWPAFNVADMAITFGVLALVWVLEQSERDHGSARRAR
ncbi:signal peptidase II [Baekduia soli]|uniref:Lipoprotein signal peptidase n=1 Tax=Baekduia soli TaxID=496014 RepID=A0A5B8U7T5_9ACTN|nr:signal peptidase II [Baekduia soli]QEC49124.1 signal peptidase II [Baekduia soli]